MPRKVNGHQWAKLTRMIKARDSHCHLCGGEIDQTLPQYHPWSYEVDHIIPYSAAPELQYDPNNLAGSHRDCNLRKSGANRTRPTPAPRPRPSRDW